MKKILLFLGVITSVTSASAENLKTVFNSQTGKSDYITAITTNTITPGAGVAISCTSGVCTVSTAGSSASNLEAIFGTARSSPTATIICPTGDCVGAVNGSTITLRLDPNATYYIHLGDTLQAGSTFYVSSGTVRSLNIAGDGIYMGAGTTIAYGTTSPTKNFDLRGTTGDTSPLMSVQHTNGIAAAYQSSSNNAAATYANNATGSGAFAISVTKTAGAAQAANFSVLSTTSIYSSATSGTAALLQASGANGVAFEVLSGSIIVRTPQLSSFAYGVSAGSFTGAGLTDCADSTHAVGWSASSNLFSCQSMAGGGGTPGSPVGSLQWNSAGSFAGAAGTVVTASSVTLPLSVFKSSVTFLHGAESTGNGAQGSDFPAMVDIYSGDALNGHSVLWDVGSVNHIAQCYLQDGMGLICQQGYLTSELDFGHRSVTQVGSTQSTNQFVDLWNGGEMDLQTTTSGGPIVLKPQALETVRVSSISVTIVSSATIKGAKGLGVTYSVSAGSFTGAGLTTCGDSTHGLGWSSSDNLFTCQSITGSGGSGASVYPATGTPSFPFGFVAASSITVSSNTVLPGATFYNSANVMMGQNGFSVGITSNAVLAGATFYNNGTPIFTNIINNGLTASLPMQTNASKQEISAAIDLSGAQATGVMAAGRMPALTGDITNSAGALATTAAANQPNIKTFSSSITVTNTAGISDTGPLSASTGTFYTTTITTAAFVVKSTTSLSILNVDNTAPVGGDFILTLSTVAGGSGPPIFAVNTYGHVISSGTTPAAGSCGTTPVPNTNSTDYVGAITWTGPATSCAITFANAFASTPFCIGTSTLNAVGYSATTTGVTFNFSNLVGSTVTWHCDAGKGG